MNAHQLGADGVIINTIVVDSLDVFPALVDASIGGTIGDSVVDGAVVPKPIPPTPVPESVTPRQIRQALTAAGLRESVEEAISFSDQDTRDWYEFATEFRRDHEMVAALAAALNVTSQQLDDLWILAASL